MSEDGIVEIAFFFEMSLDAGAGADADICQKSRKRRDT
jgi:hypothetical protein